MPASIVNTNLAVAISNASDRVISVASATGFVAGYGLYIDREFMIITGISSTNISVVRGAGGTRATPHLIGTVLYVAPKNYFTTYDRQGAGVNADQLVSPYINIMTGNVWSVIGGKWYAGNTYAATTNYGLSPAIWSDCPLDKMLVDPAYGVFDGDDFDGKTGIAADAHKYDLVGANGTVAPVAAVPGGAWLLATGATDNDEANLTTNNAVAGLIKADAVSTWWFEARVKMTTINVECGAFVGLVEEAGVANDFFTDDTCVIKVIDLLGFQVVHATAAANYWNTVMQINAGAQAVVKANIAVSAVTHQKLGMKSVAGLVTFYIDGVPQADTVLSSAANFPLNQVMCVGFGVKTGKAAVQSMTIDWWKAAQTRLAN